MSCLHVCPSCERHVRSEEKECPFCATALPDDFGVCGEPRAVGRPLTRAAFILMSATALTACGKSASPGPGGPGGGAEIYGPPPVEVRPDASANTQNQPPTVQPEAVTVYGPPPVADSATAPSEPKPVPKKK
jgi:hypothetical protein